MNLARIIEGLRNELEDIERAIQALEPLVVSSRKCRGRLPKWMSDRAAKAGSTGRPPDHRTGKPALLS